MYIHSGRTIQKGYGWGGIFRSILRFAVPVATKVAKTALRHGTKRVAKAVLKKTMKRALRGAKKVAIREGVAAVGDLLSGSSLKEVGKKRMASVQRTLEQHSGPKKRRKIRTVPMKKRNLKKGNRKRGRGQRKIKKAVF